ncbi:MAG: methyltransferase domain-containing protein [Actinomycetota bacterium]
MLVKSKPNMSGYTDVDAANDPGRYFRRLDQVGASEFWRSIRASALTSLALSAGERALDVGCGAGSEVLAMAARTGRDGRAVGVDLSSAMVREARSRAAALGSNAEFVQASALRLPFQAHSFHACRVERVLQHLDAPEAALAEIVRTARSGARVVVIEPDYATLRIVGADPRITASVLAVRRAHFRSDEIGRRAPRILRNLGVVDLLVAPAASTTADFAALKTLLREKYVAPALEAGAISSSQSSQWLEDLAQSAATGSFRHSVVVYRVQGRVP